MNIYLIPHTWARHVAVGMVVGGAALFAWWVYLNLAVVLGPSLFEYYLIWSIGAEGQIFLGMLAGVISFTSLFAEGSMRRRAIFWRLFYPVLGTAVAFFGTMFWVTQVELIMPWVTGTDTSELLADSSLTTLRYQLLQWMGAGLFSGMGPLIARGLAKLVNWIRVKLQSGVVTRFFQRIGKRMAGGALKLYKDRLTKLFGNRWFGSKDEDGKKGSDKEKEKKKLKLPPDEQPPSFIAHLLGGLTAGLIAGGLWQWLGHHLIKDLYMASAVAAFSWGFIQGVLIWGIPSELYAGWIRVLSSHRFGHRIPIDPEYGKEAERFIGHYPRGLDIFLGAEHGVAELHVSILVDSDRRYAVRGLSQQPTLIKRFLERVDLSYDPLSPTPLETTLKMEDRILLSTPEAQDETEVEFLMLPKEEG